MNLEKFPILLYDSECTLCVRFNQSLSFFDKEGVINSIPLQEDNVYKQFSYLKKEECEEQIHLLVSKDEVLVGASAIEYIVKTFPMSKKFIWLLESDKGKKTIDFFYNKVNELKQKHLKGCSGCNRNKKSSID